MVGTTTPMQFLIPCGVSILIYPRCNSLSQAETTADRKDRDLLQGTLKSLAERLGYRLVLSLANYKYAGTAVLIRWVGVRPVQIRGSP